MTTNKDVTGTANLMDRVSDWLSMSGHTDRVILSETDDWPLGAEGWIDSSTRGGDAERNAFGPRL